MRILDQLLGEAREPDHRLAWLKDGNGPAAADSYRYLLRTAPPLAIERAHTEAFSRLTLPQRREIARGLQVELQGRARADERDLEEPRALAQLVTQAELRQPGLVERALSADELVQTEQESLFETVAEAFTATGIAQQFLGGIDYDGAVTEQPAELSSDPELDYEEAEYDTAPFESFVDRNGVEP